MLAHVQFRIRHESLYRYDVPIQLGTHVLRLTPRPGSTRLTSQRLWVEPEPIVREQSADAFGNAIVRVDFGGTTQSLRVVSELELQTLQLPELAWSGDRLPLASAGESFAGDALSLEPYRGGSLHASVERFAAALAAEARHEPLAFLDHLTHTLFARIDRGVRPTGDARAAHETLALGSGACRDLTILFLDACRSQGLPARFVSGYQAQAQTPDGLRHLHAWADVFVPGVGWRGWDPMHGVRVGEGHVALCVAPHQAATMPIEGGYVFQGPSVTCTLDCSVTIGTS
jgi:transglutaminase-like putative cysteine protease